MRQASLAMQLTQRKTFTSRPRKRPAKPRAVLSNPEWMVLLVGIGRPFYPKVVTFLLGREARDGDVRSRPKAALDGVAKYIGVSAGVISFLILGMRDRQREDEHCRDKDCGDC
jgi:hypothetical protein